MTIAAIAGLVVVGWMGWRTLFAERAEAWLPATTITRQVSPATGSRQAEVSKPVADSAVDAGVQAAVPLIASQSSDLGSRSSGGGFAMTDPGSPPRREIGRRVPGSRTSDPGSRIPDPGTISPETAPDSSRDSDLELALYYHRAGDFTNALQRYQALLARNELNAQAHNNLGLLYQQRNRLQESARELQRAVLIEPRNAGTHNNYGVTLLMLGRLDEAVAEFRSAQALDPRNMDALVNLGLAERNAGRFDVAKETLLQVLNVSPENAAAHYNLALLYEQTNEPAQAVGHYRRFLDHAGAEHADRSAAVRARIAALSRMPE